MGRPFTNELKRNPPHQPADPIHPELPARAWRDRHGDVWIYDDSDGLMHSHETAPFPREHVERKWGPLTPEPHVSGTDEPCGYCHRRPPVGGSFAATEDGIRICKDCAA